MWKENRICEKKWNWVNREHQISHLKAVSLAKSLKVSFTKGQNPQCNEAIDRRTAPSPQQSFLEKNREFIFKSSIVTSELILNIAKSVF